MSTQPQTVHSASRPRQIRYFEFLQIALLALVLAMQLAVAGDELLLSHLLSVGPIVTVVLGLTLAVSRGRKNWARWALLILYILFFSSAAFFVLLMPGVPLIAGVLGMLLEAAVPGAVLSLAFTKQSSAWIHQKNDEDSVRIGSSTEQPQPRGQRAAVFAKLHFGGLAGLVWTLSSGGGAGVGAWVACVAFASARFARNPTGQFSWALVGFASMVGLGFGLAQSAVLAQLLRSSGRLELVRIGLVAFAWIIATVVSVFAMIFPLWWTDAEALLMAPLFMLVVMAPGVVLLAALQWALIRSCSQLTGWFWRTAVGGAIAASMGLMVGTLAGAVLPVPMEAVWAGVFGLVIGAMQAPLIPELKWRTGGSSTQEFGRYGPISDAQLISTSIQ